jgi:hypothetical protein
MALIFSVVHAEMQFCLCAALLLAASICFYMGKVVVHGLVSTRLCGWLAFHWQQHQLSLYGANILLLRMQFLALRNIYLLYYVKKTAFCVKIFTNLVSVLWTVFVRWFTEHSLLLFGTVSPIQQLWDVCLPKAVLKQQHNLNYSFILHLTCCSKPGEYLLPCLKFP